MKHYPPGKDASTRPVHRLEIFSDGVFAIAITLLILELIQLLHTSHKEGLQNLLLDHLAAFAAFVIGFVTILICWINHDLVFSHVRRSDANLPWMNGFVLMIVSFTPFSTAVLADYFQAETQLALLFFGFNYVVMATAAWCFTSYIYNRRLIENDSRRLLHRYKTLYSYSIVFSLFALVVCIFSVPLAICFYFFLFMAFAFPERTARIIMFWGRRNKGYTTRLA